MKHIVTFAGEDRPEKIVHVDLGFFIQGDYVHVPAEDFMPEADGPSSPATAKEEMDAARSYYVATLIHYIPMWEEPFVYVVLRPYTLPFTTILGESPEGTIIDP